MPASLTVVIAAKNCAGRIEGTILPWRALAEEIIVVDQMSTDGTPELALKLGAHVLRNDPPGGNFDLNRKLGMQEAKGEWILYIDTDERPTAELLTEVRAFLAAPPSDVNGVRIPNLFYFLGKPLRHGIYRARSAEIRMVRQGWWRYPCEDGFHRGVSVEGTTIRFRHPYKHFNVNSLSEWFLKTDQYTEHDAEKAVREAGASVRVSTLGAILGAKWFFLKHFFWRLGFLDGFRGFVSTFYFMLYHLTLRVKIWEKREQRGLMEERDFLRPMEGPRR